MPCYTARHFFLQGIAIWFALRYNAFCGKSPVRYLGLLSRADSIKGLVLRPVSNLVEERNKRRTPHIVWCARTMRLGSACWLRQPNISPPQGRARQNRTTNQLGSNTEKKALNALPCGGAFFVKDFSSVLCFSETTGTVTKNLQQFYSKPVFYLFSIPYSTINIVNIVVCFHQKRG